MVAPGSDHRAAGKGRTPTPPPLFRTGGSPRALARPWRPPAYQVETSRTWTAPVYRPPPGSLLEVTPSARPPPIAVTT